MLPKNDINKGHIHLSRLKPLSHLWLDTLERKDRTKKKNEASNNIERF